MRFKRPQVRYADTPQPATPYQAAAQVWDDRIGSARVQPKAIRRQFFACTRGKPMRSSHTWPAAWYGVAGCGVSA